MERNSASTASSVCRAASYSMEATYTALQGRRLYDALRGLPSKRSLETSHRKKRTMEQDIKENIQTTQNSDGSFALATAKKPEGKLRKTPEWYAALVQAFLIHGKNFAAVSRDLGITRFACRTAWNEGWTKQVGTELNGGVRRYEKVDWAPPIKNKIAEYQVLARAKLEEERRAVDKEKEDREAALRDAVEKAKADLVDSRALQGRTVKQARANSIALMGVSGNLLQAAAQLSKKVARLVSDPNWTPSPKQAVSLLGRMAEITKMGVESASIADEMERKALGEPDMVFGFDVSMSVEDAVSEIHQGYAALQRSQAMGQLKLVEAVASETVDRVENNDAEDDETEGEEEDVQAEMD